MELNQEINHQVAELLANPSKVRPAHAQMLATLAKTYPYYQPIHILLAKANSNHPNYNQLLTKAALYNNGFVVHQAIFSTETLVVDQDLNIITYPAISFKNNKAAQTHEAEDDKATVLKTATVDGQQENDEQEVFEEISEVDSIANIATEKPDFVVNEIATVEDIPDLATNSTYSSSDEDEVYEEINEVQIPAVIETQQENNVDEHTSLETATDFNIETIEANFEETDASLEDGIEGTAIENETIADESGNVPINENSKVDFEVAKQDESKDFAFESVIATDFFAFEKNFSEEPNTVTTNTIPQPEEYNQQAEDESVVVSKYNDDKLPFTFLWWLNKTRKEHAQIFQPYVTAKKTMVTGELQQQYVEHIFHIQTPFTEENREIGDAQNKEHQIIDSFIKNDPIIKALKPEQIDNENKAKKSAEDHYDLVSETLASIYIEQMLYHKAIDTYQKLSLKFPEKSRYFADLIQSLEKKI